MATSIVSVLIEVVVTVRISGGGEFSLVER